MELHGIFDDGVCADEYLHVAGDESFEHLLPFLAFHHAGEQLDAQGHVAEQLANGLQVLFGEYLGGCHDAGLIAVAYGEEHGHECDECLA